MKARQFLLVSLCSAAMLFSACDDSDNSSNGNNGNPSNGDSSNTGDGSTGDNGSGGNGTLQAECGDNQCAEGEEKTCPQDCEEVKCGNGRCDDDEDHTSCPKDCDEPHCGNGTCEPALEETYLTCSLDCPKKDIEKCGNGICSIEELQFGDCPYDCPIDDPCGNGKCEEEFGEQDETSEQYCPMDCVVPDCGDDMCSGNENADNCPQDCTVLTRAEFDALGERAYRFFFDLNVALPEDDAEIASGKKVLSNEEFFSFPYPSVLRTDEYGRARLFGYPIPGIASTLDLIKEMKHYIETERAGFSAASAVYFRSTHDLSIDNTFPEPMETVEADSCFQLINVEKTSSHYGERVPVYVSFHADGDVLWSANTLVMRPVPGMIMHPGDRHVAIVQDCLRAENHSIDQSIKLSYLLKKRAPAEMMARMGYYVDALNDLGYDLSKITAFTGFDTIDAVSEMMQMAERLKGKGNVVKDGNGLAVGKYEKSASYGYFFQGEFNTVNFMEGTAPYNTLGSGQMVFDENGKLKTRPKLEKVKFGISIPSTPMPANGYPIIVYGHGTGGGYNTHCRTMQSGYTDEGNWLLSSGVPVAMIGFDASLHGDRGNVSTDIDMYLAFLKNPLSIRESWRQTVLDMLVLYDLLERGEIVLPSPVEGGEPIKFDPSFGMYMGHSQGSQEGGLLLGLTGQIKNAFLSAGGGNITQAFTDLELDMSEINFSLGGIKLTGKKTVSDLVGQFLLGVKDGEVTLDTFITNHFVQPLLDPIEPLNYTHRFIKEPAEGWVSKNIAQTIGLGDQSTPNAAQYSMAVSIGLPPIGRVFAKPTDGMKFSGLDKSVGNEVSQNISVADGTKSVTGGVAQFEYTGYDNPHFVIYRMAGARDMYTNFFKSVLAGETKITVDPSKQTGSY
ncbi:MAG: hypothetical protein IIY06_01335 [Proteobacteria bacterium]|nr:hypothetical protein [Pseudomonadota bacterium]